MSDEIKHEVSRGDAERAEKAKARFIYDSESGYVRDTALDGDDEGWLTTAEEVFFGMSPALDDAIDGAVSLKAELDALRAGFDPRVALPEEGAGMVVIEILTAPMIVPNGITVAHLRYGGDSFYESFANGRVIPVEKVVRWWHLPSPSNFAAPEVSP